MWYTSARESILPCQQLNLKRMEQNASQKGEPNQCSIGCTILSQADNDLKGVREHYGKLTWHYIWPLKPLCWIAKLSESPDPP